MSGPELGTDRISGLNIRFRSCFKKNLEMHQILTRILKKNYIRTSEGRAPASELVLQRGGLPSEIALQGEASARVQNCVSRGRCGLRKTENIFSANNE